MQFYSLVLLAVISSAISMVTSLLPVALAHCMNEWLYEEMPVEDAEIIVHVFFALIAIITIISGAVLSPLVYGIGVFSMLPGVLLGTHILRKDFEMKKSP